MRARNEEFDNNLALIVEFVQEAKADKRHLYQTRPKKNMREIVEIDFRQANVNGHEKYT